MNFNTNYFKGGLFIAVFVAVTWYAKGSSHPDWAWYATLAAIVALLLLLGYWIMNLPLGIFVSERNLVSLSRIQLVVWTVIVFSAYLVILLQRIRCGVADPLAVNLDPNLWAVLGISTASFVGTPMVLDGKTRKTADPTAVNTASLVLNENAGAIQQNSKGTLYCNSKPSDARFTDIFQGDEIGDTAYVDISKVQMFLLTVFVLAAYCHDLCTNLAGGQLVLPPLSTSELQLLGLSHAGYLTYKATNHTTSTPTAS